LSGMYVLTDKGADSVARLLGPAAMQHDCRAPILTMSDGPEKRE
jgi:hypothetical protein